MNVSHVHGRNNFLASIPQRASALLMTLVMLASGCSTPDGGDFSKLVDAVGDLSKAAKEKLVRYAMNRRAIEFLGAKDGNKLVGRVECYREDGSFFDAAEVLVDDVLWCLSNPMHVYLQCTQEIVDGLAEKFPTMPEAHAKWGKFDKCYGELSWDFRDSFIDNELLDPAAWDDAEIARAVLSFPGPPVQIGTNDAALASAMAELVSAIRVLAPVLCALDADHWGCDTDTVDQGGDQ